MHTSHRRVFVVARCGQVDKWRDYMRLNGFALSPSTQLEVMNTVVDHDPDLAWSLVESLGADAMSNHDRARMIDILSTAPTPTAVRVACTRLIAVATSRLTWVLTLQALSVMDAFKKLAQSGDATIETCKNVLVLFAAASASHAAVCASCALRW